MFEDGKDVEETGSVLCPEFGGHPVIGSSYDYR